MNNLITLMKGFISAAVFSGWIVFSSMLLTGELFGGGQIVFTSTALAAVVTTVILTVWGFVTFCAYQVLNWVWRDD